MIRPISGSRSPPEVRSTRTKQSQGVEQLLGSACALVPHQPDETEPPDHQIMISTGVPFEANNSLMGIEWHDSPIVCWAAAAVLQ
jgi:hypothetical protein